MTGADDRAVRAAVGVGTSEHGLGLGHEPGHGLAPDRAAAVEPVLAAFSVALQARATRHRLDESRDIAPAPHGRDDKWEKTPGLNPRVL